MNDESPDLQTSSATGDARPQPDAGSEPAAAKKKRSKVSAKAAAAAIEARIGHKFADADLLATAFTHVSALKSSRKRGDSYQRLEFLGDHVLGLVVSDMLYAPFPMPTRANCRSGWPISCARKAVPMSPNRSG